MMADETIADVVASMRGRAEDGRADRSTWRFYAGRVEAAAAAERAEWQRRLALCRDSIDSALLTLKKVRNHVIYMQSGGEA